MDLKMWNYIEDAKPSLLAPSRIKAKVIHQKLNIKRTCSFLRSTLIKLLLLHRTTKYCCWKLITFMSFQAVIFFAAFCKAKSVQEACTKCFVVHLLEFKILQTTWKNKTKNIKMQNLLVKNWKLRIWCSLFHFFRWFHRFQIIICEPHLAQDS